jgi:hypothetical protein
MNKKTDNVTDYPNSTDTRVALLEMSISHINETLIRFEKKIDKIDDKIDSRFFWLLGLQISSFVGLLTVIAKAVHWI